MFLSSSGSGSGSGTGSGDILFQVIAPLNKAELDDQESEGAFSSSSEVDDQESEGATHVARDRRARLGFIMLGPAVLQEQACEPFQRTILHAVWGAPL